MKLSARQMRFVRFGWLAACLAFCAWLYFRVRSESPSSTAVNFSVPTNVQPPGNVDFRVDSVGGVGPFDGAAVIGSTNLQPLGPVEFQVNPASRPPK
jgi:hypothetical protein